MDNVGPASAPRFPNYPKQVVDCNGVLEPGRIHRVLREVGSKFCAGIFGMLEAGGEMSVSTRSAAQCWERTRLVVRVSAPRRNKLRERMTSKKSPR